MTLIAADLNDMVARTAGGRHKRDSQTLQALSYFVHQRNVEAGWWTDLQTGEDLHGKRNMGELLCLVHSEVSEAYEGFIADARDDKLPHHWMVEVELADILIRLFDLAGGFDLRLGPAYTAINVILPEATAWFEQHICCIHAAISRAMEGHRKNKPDSDCPPFAQLETALAETVLRVLRVARIWHLDIGDAFAEKVEFNRSRADHGPENRRATGGKAY